MGTRTLFLTTGMLISGVCNTILNKYQDMTCVENCDDPEKSKYFEQPIWQTFNMFVGETLCYILVYALLIWEYHKARKYAPLAADGTLTADSEGITVIEENTNNDAKVEEELTGWRVYLFWLPTLCDICGTTVRIKFLFQNNSFEWVYYSTEINERSIALF
jgi:hypothetical protein